MPDRKRRYGFMYVAQVQFVSCAGRQSVLSDTEAKHDRLFQTRGFVLAILDATLTLAVRCSTEDPALM